MFRFTRPSLFLSSFFVILLLGRDYETGDLSARLRHPDSKIPIYEGTLPRKEQLLRILLAIDSSQQSNMALEEVLRRPWPENSHVRVLTVVERLPLGLLGFPTAYFKDLISAGTVMAQAAVDGACKKLIDRFGNSIRVSGDVLEGSPKHLIVSIAEEWHADLIILGAYGHGHLAHFLMGSVCQSVVMHAKCSVEVVRPAH